jgi:hypothetical protein
VASKNIVLKCKSEKIIKKAAVKKGKESISKNAVIKIANIYRDK